MVQRHQSETHPQPTTAWVDRRRRPPPSRAVPDTSRVGGPHLGRVPHWAHLPRGGQWSQRGLQPSPPNFSLSARMPPTPPWLTPPPQVVEQSKGPPSGDALPLGEVGRGETAPRGGSGTNGGGSFPTLYQARPAKGRRRYANQPHSLALLKVLRSEARPLATWDFERRYCP